MRLVLAIAALGFSLAFVVHLVEAAAPLRLQVRPEHFAFYGSDMEIRVHVERSDEPRTLAIVVDAEEFYTSSLQELDASSAPTRPSLWIKRPPPGHYAIAAELRERGRVSAIVRTSTVILDGVAPRH